MNGIAEILASGQCPSLIISSGKTEQRKLEDESAKKLLKGCRALEEKDGDFMRGSGMGKKVVKEVWNAELSDSRKTSITDRYDERMLRIEEAASKLPDAES